MRVSPPFRIAILLAALATLSGCDPVLAQAVGTRALVVAKCNQQTFAQFLNGQQNYAPLTIDTSGGLCPPLTSSSSGQAVYGPDATGNAPSKPPVLMGLLDSSGNVRPVSPSFPVPTADAAADAALGTTADPATASGANTSVVGALRAIRDKLLGTVRVDGSAVTQPVSATALPLPSGAATAANQASVQSAAGTAASALTGVQGGGSGSIPVLVQVQNQPTNQTVSGTVTANQGAAGSTAWKVDGSGVTQPVSAAALPLPSGAATAANQTATTSAAGSAPTTVTGIQGVSGGTPVPVSGTTTANQGTAGASAWKVDGSSVTQPVSAASLPLPVGAATAANQNSTAAGTSASNGQGVQGVTGGVPVATNPTQQAGVALGAPTAYGTAPTGNVAGVNANVTASALPSGAATSANQASVTSAAGTAPSQALGVQSAQGTPLATAAAQARNIQFTDYNGASVAASASLQGAIRAVPSTISRLTANLLVNQSGNLVIYGCSNSDCATGTLITLAQQTFSVTAGTNTPVALNYTAVGTYMRWQWNNTSANAATVSALSSFTAN